MAYPNLVDRYIVYGLIDPTTNLIRYVGKSSKGLYRAREHGQAWSLKKNAHTHCARWVKSLVSKGATFEVVVLEVKPTAEELFAAEKWWVIYGRLSGWPLTNITEGGRGAIGRVCSPATRKRIGEANTGRKHSEAAKLAMRKRLLGNTHTLGFKHSLASRQKMSKSQAGRNHSEASKQKMSAVQIKLRRKWTDEELVAAVAASDSMKEVLRKLSQRGHPDRVRKAIDRLNLNTDHFLFTRRSKK